MSIGTFNANLLYADYGKFEYADMNGVRNGGRFFANDLAISVGYGRPINEKWSVGSQIRFLGSFYSIDKEELEKKYHNRNDFINHYIGYDMNELKNKLDYMLCERMRKSKEKKNFYEG